MWLRLSCLIFLICVAVPSHAEDDAIVQWKKEIGDRLMANRRYPPEARGQTGSAAVGFVLDRSGSLISSWLKESSGSPLLDIEALAMVDRAGPFPAPPPEVDDLTFVLPVNFEKRPPRTIGPMTAADIHKEDATIRKENSEMNAKLRTLCRGC
jgi:protein TonB